MLWGLGHIEGLRRIANTYLFTFYFSGNVLSKNAICMCTFILQEKTLFLPFCHLTQIPNPDRVGTEGKIGSEHRSVREVASLFSRKSEMVYLMEINTTIN